MRVVLAWSGGKDAAIALSALRRDPTVHVEGLLTTVAREHGRSSMHGVRRALYDRQAAAIGLPIRYVMLPEAASNDAYADRMRAVIDDYHDRGVGAVAFGDIHLDDVRAYREDLLADTPLSSRFPIWGRDPDSLASRFLTAGYRATVVCVDGSALDESFAGRPYDRAFIASLPDGVDPCGENGEFHTFVHAGPPFAFPLEVERGERVTRELGEGVFHYQDLHAATEPPE